MEFDTYWQNGGYKKISDIIFAECHIFIVSNLCSYLPPRGFNELYMALNVSNRCVEDAQAETGKAGTETSAEERDLVPRLVRLALVSICEIDVTSFSEDGRGVKWLCN